jgi:hypothetical protein
MGARSEKHDYGEHWSDFAGPWRQEKGRKNLGLVEFCEPYETVELWFDPEPNDQLQMIWLLDYFRSRPEIAERLALRIVDFDLNAAHWEIPEDLADVPSDDLTAAELEIASRSWQAYRAATPEACLDVLRSDLSAFPLLRPALADLLEELPSSTTGLGATEMRLLELIASGYSHPNALYQLNQLRRTRVFNEMEIGYLVERLAHAPRPAIAGLADELRALPKEHHAGRHAAFMRSELSLTAFGHAILAHKEDFSRNNPIDRWWGGTRLTNDHLWRWKPAVLKL